MNLVSDPSNKVNTAIKQVTQMCDFLVHIKDIVTLSGYLLYTVAIALCLKIQSIYLHLKIFYWGLPWWLSGK